MPEAQTPVSRADLLHQLRAKQAELIVSPLPEAPQPVATPVPAEHEQKPEHEQLQPTIDTLYQLGNEVVNELQLEEWQNPDELVQALAKEAQQQNIIRIAVVKRVPFRDEAGAIQSEQICLEIRPTNDQEPITWKIYIADPNHPKGGDFQKLDTAIRSDSSKLTHDFFSPNVSTNQLLVSTTQEAKEHVLDIKATTFGQPPLTELRIGDTKLRVEPNDPTHAFAVNTENQPIDEPELAVAHPNLLDRLGRPANMTWQDWLAHLDEVIPKPAEQTPELLSVEIVQKGFERGYSMAAQLMHELPQTSEAMIQLLQKEGIQELELKRELSMVNPQTLATEEYIVRSHADQTSGVTLTAQMWSPNRDLQDTEITQELQDQFWQKHGVMIDLRLTFDPHHPLNQGISLTGLEATYSGKPWHSVIEIQHEMYTHELGGENEGKIVKPTWGETGEYRGVEVVEGIVPPSLDFLDQQQKYTMEEAERKTIRTQRIEVLLEQIAAEYPDALTNPGKYPEIDAFLQVIRYNQ